MKKLIALLALAPFLFACQSNHPSDVVAANTVCPISGHAVDGESHVDVDGMRVNTCCADCIQKVQANPEAALAKAYPNK